MQVHASTFQQRFNESKNEISFQMINQLSIVKD